VRAFSGSRGDPGAFTRRTAGLTALAVAVTLALPFFLSTYYTTFLANVAVLGILALSLYFAWSLAGVLSFGQAVFFGVGAYGAAYATVKYHGVAAEILFPLAGLLLAALLGGLIAYLASASRLQEFMFAIITLIVAVLGNIALGAGGDATGGTQGFFGISSITIPGTSAAASAFWIGGLAAIAFVLFTLRVERSRFGLILRAVRDNPVRARACGYNADRYKGVAFVVSAVIAAIAGYLYARQNGYSSPDLAGFELSAVVVIYLVLGGRWAVWGAFLGALLVEGFKLQLGSQRPEVASLITAAVFIPIVVAFPGGAAALIRAVFKRRRSRPTGAGRPVVPEMQRERV
jgi:ABC-type branched-subunit amino acid transport system permease subunit